MIVLDSSFLIGFYNERDAHHTAASALMKRFLSGEWGKGLLLEYVVLEVVTVLLMRRDAGAAARVGRLLLDAEELDFVFCSGLFSNGFSSFTQQRSTRLSFVDMAIVQVARQRAEGRILTFDEEFGKIAGIHIPENSTD